jgi:uncharacterized protein YodC (DUF2158 family)
MKFKAGDVVTLKSGSPDMTIVSASDEGLTCFWFVGKRRFRETFPPEALQKRRKTSGKPPNVRISFVDPRTKRVISTLRSDGKLDRPAN